MSLPNGSRTPFIPRGRRNYIMNSHGDACHFAKSRIPSCSAEGICAGTSLHGVGSSESRQVDCTLFRGGANDS